MNKSLTEANKKQVLALVQESSIKTMWQSTAKADGKLAADRLVARKTSLPVSTIRAARYYW